MADQRPSREDIDKITKLFIDRGQIIAVGFAAMMMARYPEADEKQKAAMRFAYIGGAQHLWATMMAIMGPGTEPTEAELMRMDLIDMELRVFANSVGAAS